MSLTVSIVVTFVRGARLLHEIIAFPTKVITLLYVQIMYFPCNQGYRQSMKDCRLTFCKCLGGFCLLKRRKPKAMHNIEYHEYPENYNKDKIFKLLNHYVETRTWQEGGHLSRIDWRPNQPLACRADAEDFIEKHDNGNYHCLAVRYYETDYQKPTKAYTTLLMRMKKAEERYNRLNGEVYPNTVKAAYIGCKHCGSRLNRHHLLTNRQTFISLNSCPICGGDLRPASTLETIQKAKKTVDTINEKLQEEIRKMSKRNNKIMWLVKIEYHT